MKRLVGSVILLCWLAALAPGQQSDWEVWNFLVGTWDGEGSGRPGQGGGWFSLAPDLQHRVLVRHSHSEYPARGAAPAVKHDDLMVIYRENGAWRAMYWDNEDHIIRYTATVANGSATFVSESAPKAPTYRLTYKTGPKDTVEVVFEIAAPGSLEFKRYVSGISRRRGSR